MTDNRWPKLVVDDWTSTRDLLHMWLQIVGKVEMVSTSLINHWWNVSYEISARGFRTRLMHGDSDSFDAEFDFIDSQLVVRSTSGKKHTIALESGSVSDFWHRLEESLDDLALGCSIVPMPNEVPHSVPFPDDTTHRDYDAEAALTFWRQIVSMEPAFAAWRSGFIGKDSPVQLFWGSLDLSVTRFSGRSAPPHTGNPPNCPPWVMAEAESRENAAAGFWPGGSAEGSFYAYMYPAPKGYSDAKLSVGTYDDTLGEWILPYEDVRTSSDPDKMLLAFLNATYELGADAAGWDRDNLEVNPHRLDDRIYRGQAAWRHRL